MAITTVNAFYQGISGGGVGTSVASVPTVTGQILASQISGDASLDLEGFCLPVLDGAATTFTLNWIDGTNTLPFPPSLALGFRTDPPAWVASQIYPLGAIVLGLGHVQQVSAVSPGTQGKTAAIVPTFSTAGSTVVDGTLTWKDLGAIAVGTVGVTSITAITSTSALVTISAVGSATNVAVVTFRIIR
jgi:hypothetical protein